MITVFLFYALFYILNKRNIIVKTLIKNTILAIIVDMILFFIESVLYISRFIDLLTYICLI